MRLHRCFSMWRQVPEQWLVPLHDVIWWWVLLQGDGGVCELHHAASKLCGTGSGSRYIEQSRTQWSLCLRQQWRHRWALVLHPVKQQSTLRLLTFTIFALEIHVFHHLCNQPKTHFLFISFQKSISDLPSVLFVAAIFSAWDQDQRMIELVCRFGFDGCRCVHWSEPVRGWRWRLAVAGRLDSQCRHLFLPPSANPNASYWMQWELMQLTI